MQFETIDVRKLLPQRPPFVMIDSLLHCDLEITQTLLTVRKDNIFFENGGLSAPGLVENIAQTCAVRMGYINTYIHSETVKLGFIGAIRNMEFFRLPAAGERLLTRIRTLDEVFRITLVEAAVYVGDELIASCEMKISITDIDKTA